MIEFMKFPSSDPQPPNLGVLRAFIFDLDGTLLDTLGDLAASVNYSLRTHGMPERSINEVRGFVGNGVRKLMERAVPDGTANRCKMAVVSNKFMTATQELIRHFFPMIPVAIGEHEAEGIRKKPAPDTVFEALRQLGLPITHHPSPITYHPSPTTYYIGDSDVDIQTARNAGLPCISVLWGFRDRAFLEAHGATTFVSRPDELLGFV